MKEIPTAEMDIRCTRGEPAPCMAACPFGVDIRAFMDKMQKGSMDAAFKLYRNAVTFPRIVHALCDRPCEKVCVRNETIAMGLLEQASMDHARNTDPIDFNLPKKNKRVAVVGGGLSGLTCVLKLASKKYDVALYEKQDKVGGKLFSRMSEEIAAADIRQQFQFTEYELHLNTEVTSLNEISADAYYIATGEGGTEFSPQAGVFFGGELTGCTLIQAILQGAEAAVQIEHFLKTGTMPAEEAEQKEKACAQVDASDMPHMQQVQPEGEAYTKEEAVREAQRCLKCDCDRCKASCDLMQKYNMFPPRIKEQVDLMFRRYGHIPHREGKMICSCNDCGLCTSVCPEGTDTGTLLMQCRREMNRDGIMPLPYHQFWMEDMSFSNTEARVFLQKDKANYVFFPGCQLAASDPRYVKDAYAYLLEKEPQTALMVSCCGAPAYWAGEAAEHDKTIEGIRKEWETLGKPKAILACPTCIRMFGMHLPEIETISLFDFIHEKGLPEKAYKEQMEISVFDSCASRNEPAMQQSVRALVADMGMDNQELPYHGEKAQCCGYGGQIYPANPQYVKDLVEKRISQSERMYLTYCTNCRDTFAQAGKPAIHILDALFGRTEAHRVPPTLTQRRRNRIALAEDIYKEYGGMKPKYTHEYDSIPLEVPEELEAKLNEKLILHDDIQRTIYACEQSGKTVQDMENGNTVCHYAPGAVTYWVAYRKEDGVYKIQNVYSHRLQIEEI